MRWGFAAALVALPALACPVCGTAASEQGQAAYIMMSIVMSALPLLAIGGVVTWVVVRVRASAKAERAELARTAPNFAPPSRDVA